MIRAEPERPRVRRRKHALCLKLDFDQGLKHIREGFRLDPDHAECAGLFRRMKRAGAARWTARRRARRSRKPWRLRKRRRTRRYRERPRAARQRPTSTEGVRTRLADCAAAIASQEDHKPAYFTQATALLHLQAPGG